MTNCPFKRYAIVTGANDQAHAEAYLPDNYRVIYGCQTIAGRYVIAGYDEAGWTLDAYVIPRYASGFIACEEIDLSHPLMKHVPQDAVIEPVNPADLDEFGRGLGEINAEEE